MGNNLPAVLGPSRTRVFEGRTGVASAGAPLGGVHLLRGRSAIVGMRPMLVELARRTGQAGTMDALEYLVHSPTALSKTPFLVLVGVRPGVTAARATASDVDGAVLLYEYRVAGIGTGVFATDDVAGQRTVIASPEIRMEVAETAARALAERGASISLISLEAEMAEEERAALRLREGPVCDGTVRTRTVARDLMLEPTLEGTLARLGRHTRRNLRYYRRRAQTALGAEFVPAVEMTHEEFLELSRSSTNQIPDVEAAWRFACLGASPGRMFAGVRDRNGRWLSVIAGRREARVTEVEWQMNRADLPRYSLSTVMRSFLLEHEVGLGMKQMTFKGGTPHSIRHSLLPSQSVDIGLVRRSVVGWVMRRICVLVLPKSNFLRGLLLDTDVTWTRTGGDLRG